MAARRHRRGAAAIQALGSRLHDVVEPKGRAILTALHRALALYELKYRRRNRFDDEGPQPSPSALPAASNG